jgi:hypothetical protein
VDIGRAKTHQYGPLLQLSSQALKALKRLALNQSLRFPNPGFAWPTLMSRPLFPGDRQDVVIGNVCDRHGDLCGRKFDLLVPKDHLMDSLFNLPATQGQSVRVANFCGRQLHDALSSGMRARSGVSCFGFRSDYPPSPWRPDAFLLSHCSIVAKDRTSREISVTPFKVVYCVQYS